MAKETLIYQLEHFGFRYPKNEKQTLENINLEVREGDFVLLCGVSGSGKTTLLRHLKPSLAPYGVSAGEIHYGFDVRDGRIEAGYVGYVQQNPENQVVTDKVWHELAFGLESLGIANQEIRRRVAEVASFFGIESWYHKKTNELSGGQMQKLNLASALVMKPKVLVLDEPTSFLDPIAASDFLQTLVKINRELGITIVMTEHRPDDVLSYASKVVVMEDGKILMSGSPEEVAVTLHHMRHPLLHAMPAPFRIWSDCDGKSAHVPLTVKDGRQWLGDVCESQEQRSCVRTWTHESAARCPDDYPAVHANNIWYRYKEEGRDTLKEFQLSLGKGEILVLMGGNGVGKSTILKILAGIYKPHRGSVVTDGKIGYMPQNPELLFLKKTVREDLYDTLKYSDSKNQKPEEIAKFLGIEDLWDRHPYDLSGGEQHKAALAKILLYEPDILLLDEPTKGLDAGFKKEFSEILRELKKRGKSILMTGHDTEFCADIADRCAMIFDGSVVSEAEPREFFAGNTFYTTPAARMCSSLIEGVITVRDAVDALTSTSMDRTRAENPEELQLREGARQSRGIGLKKESSAILPANAIGKGRLSKRSLFSVAIALLLMPLTLWFGETFLQGKKYYFISLLLLFEMMLPFFLIYEGRKPKAREIVIVASLCAIAVAGRLAFFMLPQFKPVMAVVIVSGIVFGGETGFLVGAVSMFASNLFFSQGVWTPWQMVAMGLIGLLAGLVFRRNTSVPPKGGMMLFGFLAAIAVYGGMMNFSSAVIWSVDINWKTVLPYYATGFPFDVVHGIATAFFLWIGGEAMIEKLERIKYKYGLM